MKLLFSLLLLMLLIGCSGITVNYDYDKNENFVELKTYRWGKSDSANDALSNNEILKGNLIYVTDSIMKSKNYILVQDSLDAELTLVVFATVRSDTSLVTTTDASYSMGMGYGGYYGPSYGRVPGGAYNYGWYNPWYGPSYSSLSVTSPTTSTTSLQVHQEGTVIFDIVKTETQKLIWRGTAEKTIQHYSSAKKSDNVLRIIVDRVFKNFPPPVAK